jgi:hypothetical protein
MKLARAILIGLAGLLVIVVGVEAEHTYRLNVCSEKSERQLMTVESKADAIDAAKKWIRKDDFFDSQKYGGAENFLRMVEHTPNCCDVSRSVTPFGVVLWDVQLEGHLGQEAYAAKMTMTRCGEIMADSAGWIQLRP